MEKIYSALNKNVFVKEIQQEVKVGSLYIPDSLDVDFTIGEVISISDGYWENGMFIPAIVQPGDIVAFAKVSGTKVNFNGMSMIRVFATDLVAKEVKGRIIENKEGEK